MQLEDIVDACVRADKNRIFTQRVRNKEAPNYFTIIKNPIDLSIMKGKAKRRAYTDLPMFQNDLVLMRQNSEQYNGPDHAVTAIARDLERLADDLIQQQSLDKFEL